MMDSNTTSLILPEVGFGPSAEGRFDFTLTFEGAILSILPSALFLILAPQRLFWLLRQPYKVTKSRQSVIKLSVIGVYTVLQFAILLYWAVGPVRLAIQTAAGAVVFVSGFVLLFVSHAEHTRSLNPSTLITAYLLLTLLFDCAMARTLWLLQDTGVLARLVTTAVVIKVIALSVEVWEKGSILLNRYRHLSPEVTSGILSHAVFWWLNPLMRTGFGRFLTEQDMYPIHDSMAARKLLTEAQTLWGSVNTSGELALAIATLRANKYVFTSGVIARLCVIAFKYTLPFLIKATTSFSEDVSQTDAVGWGLTGAWFLVLVGRGISNAFYYQMTYRFVTSVRGSLCSLIYCKTLDLSVTALDESVAVTLMSTDTENICQTSALLHEVWASPIECAVALYLLQMQLGLAALAPVIVTIIATITIMQLAKYIGQAQKRWVRGIQTRVDVTASVLGSMKEVKMLGFSDVVAKIVQDLRVEELKLSKRYRKLICLRVFIGSTTQTISPLATFVTFVIMAKTTGQPLNTASAYTSLSLIYLLTDPIVTLIRAIPLISAALACFARIQNFLSSDSREDLRLPLSEQVATSNDANESSFTPPENSIATELRNLTVEPALQPGDPLLVMSHASFGWAHGKPGVLKDVCLSVLKSQFTLIIGNVGAGKSTLMKAMLGEIRPLEGSIRSGIRDVAYVSQDPWIQNLTIRENILGVSRYENEWYHRVVHVCGLEQDIAELPGKDSTKAGSSGVSLSGGQKQRLALARAVYSREEVVFLDDVFAGQDAATEQHIYQCLFAEEGLFREMGTTVVCITSTLGSLAYADHIIALGENGQILHRGTLQELLSDTTYLRGLDLKHHSPVPATKEATMVANRPTTESDFRASNNTQASPGKVLGELATYGYYFSSMPAWYTLLCVGFIALYGGSYKMTELLLSFWTGHVEADQSTNNFYLWFYGMLTSFALLGITCAAYFFLIAMVPLSSEVLHARLLAAIIAAPLSFFSRTDVGVTTNRFSQDMSVIDTELPFALIDLGLNISVLAMGTVLMCVFSGYFAALVPPVIAFCWLLQKFYLRTSRQIRLLDLEAKSPLFTQFLDLLQGLTSVRAFAWQDQFRENYLDLLDASQRPYYLLFCIQRWLGVVLDLMVAILAAILMVLVVKLRSQFAPQFVALAVLNVMTFSQLLTHVIQDWTQLETSFGAVARVKSFCGETENENLPPEVSPVPEGWPTRGHVEIKNLTASYSTGGEPAIHGVSLDIPAGSKVGICGRSGSGKSSLLATFLRLLEITPESRIAFDGIDISTIPRQTVRTAVAVVPQHPFFFKNRTIRQNLVPQTDDQTEDERIMSVLYRLKMGDVVVDRLGGLDSPLEADQLSQGQRQLLSLARAMLAGNKKIILLDEANSGVDERTERLIRQVVREEFAGRTVIAVVHRLGAVADFDRVAVMGGGGRLLEWDSPEALLARDSEFRRLWELGSN
ncbi:P-loop containing nucleoside triphosphate hydrolase protein [Coniochaeta sp. 2T2.1]|nr:P-loop containing nucleoside triphosphate hydrolase protein [Coniochaeta sp. 2T2.1]